MHFYFVYRSSLNEELHLPTTSCRIEFPFHAVHAILFENISVALVARLPTFHTHTKIPLLAFHWEFLVAEICHVTFSIKNSKRSARTSTFLNQGRINVLTVVSYWLSAPKKWHIHCHILPGLPHFAHRLMHAALLWVSIENYSSYDLRRNRWKSLKMEFDTREMKF